MANNALTALALTMQCILRVQIVGAVVGGQRLTVPSAEAISNQGEEGASLVWLDAYLDLMKSCWAHNPAERPSLDYVIRKLR